MDGLPKNKKPWGKAKERKPLALDDYFFERKLQEVYDKKEASDDMPALIKKVQKLGARVKTKVRRQKSVTKVKKAEKNRATYIDTPQRTKKRFIAKPVASKKLITPKKKQLPRLGKTVKAATRSKKRVVLVVGVVIASLSVFALLTKNKQQDTSNPQVAGATSVAQPTFETLIPNEKAKSGIKFDPTRQVASYQDTIQGGRVVVSQQKLSEKDIVDPNFLSRTATAFNLNTEVTTKKGQAFVGVNIEKNTQFAMFTYKEFLVFLQADQSYKNQTIVEYIDSLE